MRHQKDARGAWTSKKPEHQCASPPKQELGGRSATRALKLEVRNNRYFCEGLARPSPFGPKVSEPSHPQPPWPGEASKGCQRGLDFKEARASVRFAAKTRVGW